MKFLKLENRLINVDDIKEISLRKTPGKETFGIILKLFSTYEPVAYRYFLSEKEATEFLDRLYTNLES